MDWKEKEQKYTQGILTFLWEEGFATAEQVKQHVFTETTDKSLFHRRKLGKMEKAGLISRINIPIGRYHVFYLLGRGWNKIESPQAHKISPTDRDKIWNTSFPHRLKCIDARLEIERQVPFDNYYSERTLALYPQPLPRKPDFLFSAYGKKVAVEVELTYRNNKKTKQIIACWVYTLQKKMVDEVLFLTDTAAKKERLKEIIENLKDEFIQIPLSSVLFEKREYRQEKVLPGEEDLAKIFVEKIGGITNGII